MPWPTVALRGALVAALALTLSAPAALAAPFTVDSTADAVDANPGDGTCATASALCTLRAAVQETNALAGADEITVPPGSYDLTVATRGEDAAAAGDLDVVDELTITGPGASKASVSGKGNDRIFDLRASQLAVSGLALSYGRATGAGDDSGGMARVASGTTLRLQRVRMTSNNANGQGSAVDSAGTTEITSSSIDASTLFAPSALSSTGTLLVVNTTVTLGSVRVAGGTTTIRNSTLLGRTSDAVPALDLVAGTASLTNSLLGRAAPVCVGASPTSGGHNLVSDASCALNGPGDQNAVDPGLSTKSTTGDTFAYTLWAYGSSFDPPPGAGCDFDLCPRLSRAVDAADASACPATDQLGAVRPQGPVCDIGAVEAPQADLALAVSTDATSVGVGQPFTLTWTISNLGQSSVGNLLLLPTGWPALTVLSQDLVAPNDGCLVGMGGICDLHMPLEPGASLTRKLTVRADSATPDKLSFSALISADGTNAIPPRDPNTANNSSSATVSVLAPAAPTKAPNSLAPPLPKTCSVKKSGTKRNDILKGTAGPDLLRGLAGNDKLKGLAGDDCLDGGAGNDALNGGLGKDKLTGGTGNDVIDAADHTKDIVDCGKGRDRATVDKIDRVKGCEKVKRKR